MWVQYHLAPVIKVTIAKPPERAAYQDDTNSPELYEGVKIVYPPEFPGQSIRRRLAADGLGHLWQGIANAADRRREILSRYRIGKDIWYASVEVI